VKPKGIKSNQTITDRNLEIKGNVKKKAITQLVAICRQDQQQRRNHNMRKKNKKDKIRRNK
jgi:hypothetical protein